MFIFGSVGLFRVKVGDMLLQIIFGFESRTAQTAFKPTLLQVYAHVIFKFVLVAQKLSADLKKVGRKSD